MTLADATVDRAELQRRTITTLRLAQVPGQAAIAGVVAVLALFVGDLLGDDRFAGSGNAAFTLGVGTDGPIVRRLQSAGEAGDRRWWPRS